jgi:peptidyl-prolyl cis-trans isomerase SurA
MMKLGTFQRAAMLIAGTCAAAAVAAPQTRPPAPAKARTARTAPSRPVPTPAAPAAAPAAPGPSASNLKLPTNPQFLGDNSNVRKATAIVNGTVITGTDVDQRMALFMLLSNGQIPADQMPALREQVLRDLVDETLEIQAAEQEKIKVTDEEINQFFARYAENFKMTPQQFAAQLRVSGSSALSVKRRIWGEMAWTRLQRNRIEPFINVSEDEVKGVMARLNAAKGTREYRVAEIFMAATPESAPTVRANLERILQQLRQGGAFAAYARQFSEASTAAVGGELGWVHPEQLPEPLAAAIRQMPVGGVSEPIAIPGGFSVLALEDTRQVLTADPRDATLSLKQLSFIFAPGTPRDQIEPKLQELVKTSQSMGGCGGADAAAKRIGAEVVTNDQVKVRDLPGSLQNTMLALQVGQATAPFGSVNDRVSILVLCGRDDPPPPGDVSYEQVYNQLTEARVNMRARRYLRDLRRDAVIDYR